MHVSAGAARMRPGNLATLHAASPNWFSWRLDRTGSQAVGSDWPLRLQDMADEVVSSLLDLFMGCDS